MKQEKVILSFVAILIGLSVAGAAFFLYQNSKKISTQNTISQSISPTPTQTSSLFLILNEPKDESLSDKKTIKVSGKTTVTATIIVLTSSDQEIIKPSLQGDFSTTIQLSEGLNYLRVQAIDENGETQTVERVIGYSSEDF
ncbi:MAG: hypothetical protein A3B38_00860 [Candidatus Levybacteria bacterium RIFCSPLOWO2_01_FULL_36_13]|nr:MAG: hypothetical protein A2684_02100 [Candidatus Levybacteria bacterium RIFCSPHIGHO2_01_FULL_36_15b]OGH35439.1 MAG: hypothetical protein A3B38_00860 [Candidatus Levybacteria bacterium RIFCSPLOWO2_01_FULL_36_13]